MHASRPPLERSKRGELRRTFDLRESYGEPCITMTFSRKGNTSPSARARAYAVKRQIDAQCVAAGNEIGINGQIKNYVRVLLTMQASLAQNVGP